MQKNVVLTGFNDFLSLMGKNVSHKYQVHLYGFKGPQAWNFFITFFAETETIWSQELVTQDFWKSYSIRPRYSTFKHFGTCSACDEIRSVVYAQCAIKFVPHMLSMDCTCKNCSHFTTGWACGNLFLVCSVCDEIGSAYAQLAIKSFPRMLSIGML